MKMLKKKSKNLGKTLKKKKKSRSPQQLPSKRKSL
jgi:hypothetical protein